MPLLSIITINYNNGAGLQKTVDSVVGQTHRDYEFIVIDGGSTDSSKDIIAKHLSQITYSVSEKDGGIYDAQNKGIAVAKGEYLLFLNSGDCFHNTNVVAAFSHFVNTTKVGIAYGNTQIIENGNKTNLQQPPQQLDKYYFFKYTLNHQACFIKKSLFDEFGLYSLQYKICSDFEFFLKVFSKYPEVYAYFNETVCDYDKTGLSSDKANYERVVKEKHAILKQYLSKEEYANCYKRALNELPFKYRFLSKVYRLPLIGPMLKNTLTALFPGDKK